MTHFKPGSPYSSQGRWWLPENPDRVLTGNLEITSDGDATLDVMGVFDDDPAQMFTPMATAPVILGDTDDGEAVTLIQASPREQRLPLGSYGGITFKPQAVYVGGHLSDPTETPFHRVVFRFKGLDEWLGITGLQTGFMQDYAGATIAYTLPKDIRLELGHNEWLTLAFTWKPTGFGSSLTEAGIRQKAEVRIDSAAGMTIDRIESLLFELLNFFCLVLDRRTAIEQLSLYSWQVIRHSLYRSEAKRISYIRGAAFPPPVDGNFDRREMLIAYPAAADRFQTMVRRWLEKHETLRPVFELYFGLIHNDRLYVENRFLSLAQALETLHRRTQPGTELPPDGHADRMTEVLAACPAAYRSWLDRKLRFSNELTLADRLRELIKPFGNWFGARKARSTFIEKTVETRNYLTHHTRMEDRQVFSDEKLFPASEKLRALLLLHMLGEIGIEHADLKEIVSANRKLSSILNLRSKGKSGRRIKASPGLSPDTIFPS